MKKKILLLCLLMFASLFIFCSCDQDHVQTETSITATFKLEGSELAKDVSITAKEKESGKRVKIKINTENETVMDIEPGIYIISGVSGNDKRISVSLQEQYFTVNKSHRIITFVVETEYQKTAIEWFLYNNSLYLACLVGCFIFLGVHKYKKEKKMSMR